MPSQLLPFTDLLESPSRKWKLPLLLRSILQGGQGNTYPSSQQITPRAQGLAVTKRHDSPAIWVFKMLLYFWIIQFYQNCGEKQKRIKIAKAENSPTVSLIILKSIPGELALALFPDHSEKLSRSIKVFPCTLWTDGWTILIKCMYWTDRVDVSDVTDIFCVHFGF